ncbi:MAG: hypothetical protein AAB367_02170 [Patescibacteria group bacterium]
MEHPEFHGEGDARMQQHRRDVLDIEDRIRRLYQTGEARDQQGMRFRETLEVNELILKLMANGKEKLKLDEVEAADLDDVLQKLLHADLARPEEEKNFSKLLDWMARYEKAEAEKDIH